MKKVLSPMLATGCCVALMAWSCGSSDDGKGKAGQPCQDDGTCDGQLLCMTTGVCQAQVTLSEFATEAAALNCHWLFACCSQDELAQIGDAMGISGQLDDEASCSNFFKSVIGASYSTPAQNAIDAERGEYFPDKAAACLGAGAQAECSGNGSDALKTLLGNCADSYNGLQSQGKECSSQVECNSGLLCVKGSCVNPKAQGDECTDGDPHLCGDGLFCNDADGTGGQCEARKAQNTDCTGISLECGSGLKCDKDTSKCVELQAMCTGGQ